MSLSYNKQTVNCMANDTGSYIRVNLLFFFFTCVHARDVAVNWKTSFVSAIAR